MKLRFTVVEAFMLALCGIYIFLFYQSISPYVFNELYTTDDGRQQLYPLWRAVYHDAFKDDPITESMLGYLSPLHWELSYIITVFTQSPVMTGHVVMTIQLILGLVFLFLLVKHYTAKIPAIFAIFWFLHSRNLPQRMTGGLPRSWAAFILAGVLYFAAKNNQKGVLIILFLGILLNPTATFMAAAFYGLLLVVKAFRLSSREDTKPQLIRYLIACPFFALIAFLTLQRPAEFGHMATLEEAESNPAFNAANGRFPFVPLKSPVTELKTVGIQAFLNKWRDLPSFMSKEGVLFSVFGFIAFIYVVSIRKKLSIIPLDLTVYFFTVILVYFMSRFFAFQLYVPDRHLQYPLNTFWIVAFTVILWKAAKMDSEIAWQIKSSVYLLLFASLLFFLGGTGLKGEANYNIKTDEFQRLHAWIRLNTARNDVFAGHPKELDLLPLATVRPAYITEETAHPFYSGYWELCKKRMEVSFRMLYANSPQELLDSMGDEKIDYFIFNRDRFTEKAIKSAGSFAPIDKVVKRLVARNKDRFLYELLDMGAYSQSIVYQDNEVIVIKPSLLKS